MKYLQSITTCIKSLSEIFYSLVVIALFSKCQSGVNVSRFLLIMIYIKNFSIWQSLPFPAKRQRAGNLFSFSCTWMNPLKKYIDSILFTNLAKNSERIIILNTYLEKTTDSAFNQTCFKSKRIYDRQLRPEVLKVTMLFGQSLATILLFCLGPLGEALVFYVLTFEFLIRIFLFKLLKLYQTELMRTERQCSAGIGGGFKKCRKLHT